NLSLKLKNGKNKSCRFFNSLQLSSETFSDRKRSLSAFSIATHQNGIAAFSSRNHLPVATQTLITARSGQTQMRASVILALIHPTRLPRFLHQAEQLALKLESVARQRLVSATFRHESSGLEED